MKKILFVLAALVIVAAGSTVGYAYPTLSGPTGLATLPDAMVAPAGQLDLAADWSKARLAVSDGVYEVSNEDVTLIPVRLLYGIGSGAEISANWTHISNSGNTNGWGIAGKYQFMREPKDQVTLAVGAGYNRISDLASALGLYGEERLTNWNVYLAATKDLSKLGEDISSESNNIRILGTLGVMYSKFSDAIDESFTEPFVALQFIARQGTSLGLEYRFKKDSVDDKAPFSVVLRHPFTKNLSAQIGMTNAALGGIGLDKQEFFGGLSYSFGIGQGSSY